MCTACLRAKSEYACKYELPLGQTRAQAMLEVQQRLRDELQCQTSLIHTLRRTERSHALQILASLRRGAYDEILSDTAPDFKSRDGRDRVYSWEEVVGKESGQAHDAPKLPRMGFFTTVLQ